MKRVWTINDVEEFIARPECKALREEISAEAANFSSLAFSLYQQIAADNSVQPFSIESYALSPNTRLSKQAIVKFVALQRQLRHRQVRAGKMHHTTPAWFSGLPAR